MVHSMELGLSANVPAAKEANFTNNSKFMVKVINQYSEKCIRED